MQVCREDGGQKGDEPPAGGAPDPRHKDPDPAEDLAGARDRDEGRRPRKGGRHHCSVHSRRPEVVEPGDNKEHRQRPSQVVAAPPRGPCGGPPSRSARISTQPSLYAEAV